MKDKDMLLLAGVVIGGIALYKISGGVSTALSQTGTGLGLGFAGIGQGISNIGQGVSNIGLGVEALGQGVGAGVAYTGAGVYQIGAGTGTFIGGASPSNILQAVRQNPEYYNLPSITPSYPSPASQTPQAPTTPQTAQPTAAVQPATSPSNKTNTSTGSSILNFISTGWTITKGEYAIASAFVKKELGIQTPQAPATMQSGTIVNQVATQAPVQSIIATTAPTTAATTATTIFNPTLNKTLTAPAGATKDLLTAMASPYWSPAYK